MAGRCPTMGLELSRCAADASRAMTSVGGESALPWGHQEVSYDPLKKSDARRTRSPQLVGKHQRVLYPGGCGVRLLFQTSPRSTRSRAHSGVSGSFVRRSETGPQFREPAARSLEVLLRQDSEKTLERCRDSLPQEGDSPARGVSPGEVARLIDSAALHFHRVILMTLYATGIRRAENACVRCSLAWFWQAPFP
jgi:integrase